MKWPIGAVLAFACIGMVPRLAHAHHVPGHGASESVRNLNSLGGGSGATGSRVMVLQEASRSSTSLNPGVTSITSVLGEWAPHSWVSLSVAAPLLVVAEDTPGVATKVGYGDTRASIRITPHADKLIHRVLTIGVNASFPTRTVRFESDPGQIWSVSSHVLFTRTYRVFFWQVMGLATLETRPAGVALDLSPALQLGARVRDLVIPSVGLLADLRVANFCTEPGGRKRFCRDSRATEVDRGVGAFRLVQTSSLSFSVDRFLLSMSLQLPLTARRDFDVGGSFSVQARF